MDLLKSTALPALLVLLMTSIGWLLDRSIDRLGTVYFVEYDDSTATSGGKAEFRLDVQNSSLSGAIDNLVVAIVCPGQGDCFAPVDPAAATPRYLGTTLYQVAPRELVRQNDGADAIQVRMSLLAGSRITLRAGLLDASRPPLVTFQPDAAQQKDFSISRGMSYSAWVARNYTALLLGALGVTIALFIAYLLLLAFWPKTGKGAES